MQHSLSEIKDKLEKALDEEKNVVDMETVVEIITILERMPITKDALESTRLGRTINELRRKTKSESLAKRAKDLVRRWRELLVKNTEANPIVQSTPGHGLGQQQYNGANNTRSAASSGRLSPGPGNLVPHPHNRHQVRGAVISPAISLPSSERSNTSPQQKALSPADPSSAASVAVAAPKQASSVDPVPKTHASNKRLRKGNSPSPDEPLKKVKRPNGLSADATSVNSHGVPSPDNVWMKTRSVHSVHSDDGSNSCELIETVPAPASVASTEGAVSEEPKKRGRKKGSKNKVKSQEAVASETSREDLVKEKMASMGRMPRVKTTQELLANLQAKSNPPRNDLVVISSVVENKASLANCLLPRGRGGFREALEMSRNKTEHIAKFLRSQSDLELSNQEFPTNRDVSEELVTREDPDASDAASLPSRLSKDMRSPAGSNSREELTVDHSESVQEVTTVQSQSPVPVEGGTDRTVEEILSRLPPVDVDAIVWEDSLSPPSSPVERHVSDEDVRRLHSEHVEGLNGNKNYGRPREVSDGEKDDDNFREWHETVSRTSYQGELLHILPYVVID